MQSKFKIFFINLFVFIFLFGTVELICRLISDSNTILNINIGGFKEYHETRGFKLKANYSAGSIKINSNSILGSEFEISNSKNNIRILTIGNSVTFSPPENNYPSILQSKLSNDFDFDIEVICAAVPGYDSFHALDWYDEFLYKLDSDIAIIYLGWNDLGQYHPYGLQYKNDNLGYTKKTFMSFMMEKFYLFRIPYFFIGRYDQKRDVDLSELTEDELNVVNNYFPDHYLKNMRTLIEKLRKNDTEVFLIPMTGLLNYDNITDDEYNKIIYPRGIKRKYNIYKSLFEKYTIAFDSVAKLTESNVIDLPSLIELPEKRNIFTDDCHINLEGAEVFGNFIAKSISKNVETRFILKTKY